MSRNLLNSLQPVYQTILNTIFPRQCLSCREHITTQEALCQTCLQQINFIGSHCCVICGLPFESAAATSARCGKCLIKLPSFSSARTVFYYDKHSKKLITNFKYNDKTHSSRHLASWLLSIGKNIIADSHMIIPVPLHRKRLFTRKYNQSALLTNELGKKANLPVHNQLLIRTKNTVPQASLFSKQRILNVSGAFKLNAKYKDYIQDKNIILIDDVMTTGATVDSCSKTLMRSGAAKVNVLTLARTVKGKT